MNTKQLRAVALAATQGEWKVVPFIDKYEETRFEIYAYPEAADYWPVTEGLIEHDAVHIAAWSPQTALAVLDLLEQADCPNDCEEGYSDIVYMDQGCIDVFASTPCQWCAKRDELLGKQL